MSILTRVLRKCQFTDPNERSLFSTKVTREIYGLEQWFQTMSSKLTDNKVAKNYLDEILILYYFKIFSTKTFRISLILVY